MMSRTFVSGPLPSAMARIAMSRSDSAPTIRSFSPTGIIPNSPFSIELAASRIVMSGLSTSTSRVITSMT